MAISTSLNNFTAFNDYASAYTAYTYQAAAADVYDADRNAQDIYRGTAVSISTAGYASISSGSGTVGTITDYPQGILSQYLGNYPETTSTSPINQNPQYVNVYWPNVFQSQGIQNQVAHPVPVVPTPVAPVKSVETPKDILLEF